MTREHPAARVYRVLVALYPRRFRDGYGVDMVLLFRCQLRDEPTLRVCTRAALDLALTIPAQHLEEHMSATSKSLVPLFYAVIAAAGVLLAIVGGTNPISAMVGLGLAGSAGTVGLLAWHRSAPIRDTPVTGTPVTGAWWKLLLAGPSMLVVVAAAANAGVDAWYLGMAAVLVALMAVVAGLVLGVVHLLTRASRLTVS